MESMEPFLSKKYKIAEYDEQFDDYLKGIGLNIITRRIAKAVQFTIECVRLSETEYALVTSVPFKVHTQRFIPGQEIAYRTLDGRNIKAIFTIEGNKITEKQTEPNREVLIIREFSMKEMLGKVFVGDVASVHKCNVLD